MLEYDDVFENAQDAYDELKEKYDKLVIEYDVLYRALMGDLEESIKMKTHLIDRYQKDINDISTRQESIKQAKKRTKEEL